jgi:ureidoglycolate lyase
VKLVAEPITAAAFEPFGDVITAPQTYGRQTFTDGLAHDARPFVLSTTHTKSSEMPLSIDKLERHTHSSQTFLPLDAKRWLVVVSTTSESSSLRAFVVPGTTGVTIGQGIWHYSLTALDSDASFAVIMWKNGTPDDTEWATITPVIIETVPASST